MRYFVLPAGMWMLFRRSFQRNLTDVLGADRSAAAEMSKRAKAKYKVIIRGLPRFERGDRFVINIVNCALFASFCLELKEQPSLDRMTVYYRESMTTGAMKRFCRMGGRRKFTKSDIASMQRTAAMKAADRNRYSWNMVFLPYADGSGYEARFSKCGICTLMGELGLSAYVPAMCRLDYTMSELGGADEFVREYTLASGGPYCDCGYKKKG
ncbi:MAG: L-2-amino-thiazoline-4-carboxylic acid hydrolase [Clostridia bacterium]|nr:L-2-amino-thiazoline-4-carboxylic acid hydrolase [Clostridia bacterium]